MGDDWIFRTAIGGIQGSGQLVQATLPSPRTTRGVATDWTACLRHTYVSLLTNQSEGVKYVSQQVGHSTIQMTLEVYGHLFKETSATAMWRFDQRLRTELLDEEPAEAVNEKLTGLAVAGRNTMNEGRTTRPQNLMETQSNNAHDVTPSNTIEVSR